MWSLLNTDSDFLLEMRKIDCAQKTWFSDIQTLVTCFVSSHIHSLEAPFLFFVTKNYKDTPYDFFQGGDNWFIWISHPN